MIAELAATCIYMAARSTELPPVILMTVLQVEGGHEGSRSPNENGSADFGPGQINTVWLDNLAQATRQSIPQTQQQLQWDGCFNIKVTASILRYQIDQAHDFWTGVGWYHSRNRTESLKYIAKVVETAKRLFGPRVITATPAPPQ